MANPEIYVLYSMDRKKEPYRLYTIQCGIAKYATSYKIYDPHWVERRRQQNEQEQKGWQEKSKEKLKALQNWFDEDLVNREFKLLQKGKGTDAVIHDQTPSVFLGLFLTLYQEIKVQQFNARWTSITVTGDIRVVNGEIKLVSVGSVWDNNVHNKYKDFLDDIKTYYPDTNKKDNHLFIYISDTKFDDLKDHDNITVRHFSPLNPHDTIDSIKGCVFDRQPNQDDLLGRMEDKRENRNIDYIRSEKFSALEQKILNRDWKGYFIHGKGGRGKSALAMEIARRLAKEARKIYAPVWIKVGEEIENIIKKTARESFQNNKKDLVANEIKNYLFSEIMKIFGQNIGDLRQFGKDYLLVIDNLELEGDDSINFVLKAIKEIFPNDDTRPYLIFTSRFGLRDPEYTDALGIKRIEVPELEKNKISDFIIRYSENSDDDINDAGIIEQITKSKNNGTFEKLVEVIAQKYGGNLRWVIKSISLLHGKEMTIEELIDLLNEEHSRYKEPLRDEEIKVNEKAFSFINKLQKQVLYILLTMGKNNPVSIDEIYGKIKELSWWKATYNTKSNLTEILCILYKYKLIFSTNQEGRTLYHIDSNDFRIILFEEEFLHSSPGAEDFLRDTAIDVGWQLEKALEYDMEKDIIGPLLEKVRAKNNKITGNYFLIAAQYTKNIEILELLRDFECDPYACEEYCLGMFFYALTRKNFLVLNWLKTSIPDLIDQQTEPSFWSSKNYLFWDDNNDLLEWLMKNKNELFYQLDEDAATVFHYAASFSKENVLNQLFKYLGEENAKKLFNCVDKNGMSVFHYATKEHNIDAMNWFYKHLEEKEAKELLNHPDEYGLTVLGNALHGKLGILDWFLKNAEDLFGYIDNNGRTILHQFSFANENDIMRSMIQFDFFLRNINDAKEMLDHLRNKWKTTWHNWSMDNSGTLFHLFTKLENKLIKTLFQPDNNGFTVFHKAAEHNYHDMDLFLMYLAQEEIKALLNIVDHEGRSVFHYTVNYDSTLLDLFLELFKINDINDLSPDHLNNTPDNDLAKIFHENTTETLNWFFDNLGKEQAIKLLYSPDKYGETVFHYAIEKCNIAALNWLWKYVPGLLDTPDLEGVTVFHLSTTGSNTAGFDWLLGILTSDHIRQLLSRPDQYGETAFDYAKKWNNTYVLDWFSKNAPEYII